MHHKSIAIFVHAFSLLLAMILHWLWCSALSYCHCLPHWHCPEASGFVLLEIIFRVRRQRDPKKQRNCHPFLHQRFACTIPQLLR